MCNIFTIMAIFLLGQGVGLVIMYFASLKMLNQTVRHSERVQELEKKIEQGVKLLSRFTCRCKNNQEG